MSNPEVKKKTFIVKVEFDGGLYAYHVIIKANILVKRSPSEIDVDGVIIYFE